MSGKTKKKDLLSESETTKNVTPEQTNNPASVTKPDDVSIPKPTGSGLDRFKSKRGATIANVGTRQNKLPVHRISDANDWVHGHPFEDYWSDEMCFVNVPSKDNKRENLHLIYEDIAMRYLDAKKIKRCRLTLMSKPHNVFFLCIVPTQNTDNKFNETALIGIEDAKTRWTEVVSRKSEGYDEYKINYAGDDDAFPPVEWPTQSLEELIEITFEGRQITSDDHPGLLRLIGKKQVLK
jgi:hypothetical protein